MKKPLLTLSSDVKALFERYPWQGNVRELRNVIERAVIFSSGGSLELQMLPPEFGAAPLDSRYQSQYMPESLPAHGDLPSALSAYERDLISSALARSKGNKSDAARALGISRYALNRRMDRLGM